jgi:hypothetical protein
MVLKLAELVFNDKPSKFNKDLTEFLKRNIETIVMKGQLKFRFKIAAAGDMHVLRDRGITHLPAMIIDKQNFVSVPSIIGELQKRVKTSRGVAPPKNDDEVVMEYLHKEIGDVKQDSEGRIMAENLDQEDEESVGNKLMDTFHQAVERRNTETPKNKRGMQPPPPQHPTRDMNADDDFGMHVRPPIANQPVRAGMPARPDNIDQVGDPYRALGNIKSEHKADDDMMRALLERLGED